MNTSPITASLISISFFANTWGVKEIKPNKLIGTSILLQWGKHSRLYCSIEGCNNKVIGKVIEHYGYLLYCAEHKKVLAG